MTLAEEHDVWHADLVRRANCAESINDDLHALAVDALGRGDIETWNRIGELQTKVIKALVARETV